MFSILDQGAKCFKRKKKRDRKTTLCRIGLYRNKTLLDLFGTWSCIYLYILHVGWIQGTICYCAIQSTECQLKDWKDDWMAELSFKTPLVDWITKLHPWGGVGVGGVILVHVQEEWIFMHKLPASCIRLFSFFFPSLVQLYIYEDWQFINLFLCIHVGIYTCIVKTKTTYMLHVYSFLFFQDLVSYM